jgi:hypothetical protein
MAAVMMLFIKEWDDTFGFNCAIPMRSSFWTNSIPEGKWETEDENFL